VDVGSSNTTSTDSGILVFLIRNYQAADYRSPDCSGFDCQLHYFLKLGLPTNFTPENQMWGTIITVLDYAILLSTFMLVYLSKLACSPFRIDPDYPAGMVGV